MKTILQSVGRGGTSRGVGGAVLLAAGLWVSGAGLARATLENYDAVIATDAAGGLTPVASLTSSVTLDGTGGVTFDFGATSGDVTMEFILEGDPSVGSDSFLAVGENTGSSLRYEQYDNTGELGFTLGGAADYQFTPGVPSPTKPAHVTFVWSATDLALKAYVNGALAGTAAGVGAGFAMPTGLGLLGANPGGTEAMVGTIYRVTVYQGILGDDVIRRHSDAFGAMVAEALSAYDLVISDDVGAGLVPVSSLTSPVTLTGSGGSAFDFGATSGDVTMEFILEGDPTHGDDSYLAVGSGSLSSLRYAQYQKTLQMGFTQIGVADYLFNPGVPSPAQATHVTYVWNSTAFTMSLYVNGALAGTVTGVSPAFVMPSGQGLIGGQGTESMVGTIYRLTVYEGVLTTDEITRHAHAFTDVLQPPIIVSFTATPGTILTHAPAVLSWEVQNAKTVTLNGTDVTALTNVTVSPPGSTTYTLVASNAFGTISSALTLMVTPPLPLLDVYDAAIAADSVAGLTPDATLTTPVTLTGTGGAPFNFGPATTDMSIEFILEGDPSTGRDAYLAVGEVTTSSLRFEQWDNSGEVGFTRATVADYLFSPPVPSSTWPTHLTYVWDSTVSSMSLYVNGLLAGTNSSVSGSFVMPTGQGWLGANDTGGEALVGTIQRVVVYDSVLTPDVVLRHGQAFLSQASPALSAYDNAVNTSAGAGLAPVARLNAPVAFTGTGGVPFDFGATSGDVTIEFILEGDPTAGRDGYLAVGANTASSLRFEQWDTTGELGFTLAGVLDYQFSPGVASPVRITHVAYVWDSTGLVMSLYTNGVLASTATGVDATFAMPAGLGWLGSSAIGTETMVGTIYRVVVYDDMVPTDVIQAHAAAFLSVSRPPVLSLQVLAAHAVITLSDGVPGQHYRVDYRNSLAPADTWQLLEDIPSLSGTTATITDPTTVASQPQRYYRAVLVQ